MRQQKTDSADLKRSRKFLMANKQPSKQIYRDSPQNLYTEITLKTYIHR